MGSEVEVGLDNLGLKMVYHDYSINDPKKYYKMLRRCGLTRYNKRMQ